MQWGAGSGVGRRWGVTVCVCRCVVLSDPLKDSSRTQESWNAFLTKLRTLLLMSFTKNLGKFEDDMRTLREKRTEPGWGFCEYFMVQVLGSLGRRQKTGGEVYVLPETGWNVSASLLGGDEPSWRKHQSGLGLGLGPTARGVHKE